MPAPRASTAAIRHALEAWTEAYGRPGAVEITRDGTIRIIAAVDRIPEPEQPAQPRKWNAGK